MKPAIQAIAAIDTIGYTRVSSEEQAHERKTSLADQRAAIAQLAQLLGRTVGRVFEDAGASGGREDRPAFVALVAFCEQHPRPSSSRGLVLVLNDSRWGRFPDPGMANYWRMHCQRAGWLLRFVENHAEDIGTREIMRSLHATQATMYREALRANTRRGARGAASKGFWQNEAPMGYRRSATREDGVVRVLEPGQRKAADEVSRLVLGPPAEVAIIQEIFERYAGGCGCNRNLVNELIARWPSRRWSAGVLRDLLQNPAYAGDIVWCRQVRDDDGRQQKTDRSSWVVVHDTHPAIVSRELYGRVQARMGVRRRETRAAVGRYPLSGLLTCAICGRPYVGGGGTGPANDPDRYRFYRDRGGSGHAPACPGQTGTLNARWIEAQVVDVVAKVVAAPATRRAIEAEIARATSAAETAIGDDRAHLERRRQQLLDEQKRLVAAVARGVVQEAEAAAHLATQRSEIAAATAALERARFAQRGASTSAADRDRLLDLASDFRRVVAHANGVQLRELLRPWIASAAVDKVKRKLILTLRRVPQAGVHSFESFNDAKLLKATPLVCRSISLPPARKRRVA